MAAPMEMISADRHYASILLLQLTVCVFIAHAQGFKSLGAHSPATGGPIVLYGKFPPPSVFYHHFVKTGKLLLMRNVLNETGYGIYQTWTDDYLRDRYGDDTIEIEKSRKENRKSPKSKLKFSKFLELYEQIEMYMINSSSKAMQDEVMVPFTLQCGGFQNVMQGSYVWFSGGNTRSVLHYDVLDNIKCLLDGKKTLVFIDKKHKKKVEADGFVQNGRYSLVDVDAVDPGSFPGIAQAPWSEINMQKGDCVYIPYKFYHHVKSDQGRNLAVNLWFSHLLWFNKSDCGDVDRNTPLKPYSHFSLASSNEQLRSELFSTFEGMAEVKKEAFYERSLCTVTENEQMWNMINKNGDGKITWEEIYSVNMDKLVLEIPECFQNLVRSDIEEKTTVSEESQNVPKDTNQSKQTDKKKTVHDEF